MIWLMTSAWSENGLKYDYELTEVGLKLEPVLLAIGKWGGGNIDGVNNVQDIIAMYKEKKNWAQ